MLSLFLLPYIAKTLWWVGVNKGQDIALETAAEKRRVLADELRADPLELAKSPERPSGLSERQWFEELALKQTVDYLGAVKAGWKEWRVFQLVLGADKGLTYWITAVLILTYNVLRFVLTLRVSHLRQDEELRGPSPLYEPHTALRHELSKVKGWAARGAASISWAKECLRSIFWLSWLHRAANILLYVALASGIWHLLYWLTRPVWLPG